MSITPDKAPVIWLCRPLADSERMANILQNQNIPNIISPVMEISLLPNEETPPNFSPDAVILTSQHALYAAKSIARKTPVFAVGNSLSERLTLLGFTTIYTYPSAQTLLDSVQTKCSKNQSIHYLRGETVRLDMARILKETRFNISETICYKAKPTGTLDTRLNKFLNTPSCPIIVPFHAIQTANYCAELLDQQGLSATKKTIHACCISPVVADAAKQSGFSNRYLSTQANYTSMQALVIEQFHAKLATTQ